MLSWTVNQIHPICMSRQAVQCRAVASHGILPNACCMREVGELDLANTGEKRAQQMRTEREDRRSRKRERFAASILSRRAAGRDLCVPIDRSGQETGWHRRDRGTQADGVPRSSLMQCCMQRDVAQTLRHSGSPPAALPLPIHFSRSIDHLRAGRPRMLPRLVVSCWGSRSASSLSLATSQGNTRGPHTNVRLRHQPPAPTMQANNQLRHIINHLWNYMDPGLVRGMVDYWAFGLGPGCGTG